MKTLKKLLWLAAVLLCIVSCSKEEVTEKVIEVPEGKVLVETEIVVDGVIQSKTRASSEAGYTTGDGLYDKTDRVTVAAVANDGYELTSFYDKKDPSANLGSSYTFDVLEPRTFKAEFARKYTITVSASPTAGGTVSGGGTYRSGKPCTLTATPNAGYTFDGWYEGSTKLSSNTSYSFTVSSNRTITGKFAAPIIIEINDREQKTNGFNRIFSRQIICSGHNISLELNTIVTYWSSYNKDYTFKTGDQSKEVLRWDYNNSWGPNDEPIEEDIRIEFVSFSLMIDGVKIISKETYTSKSTNDLYYDQVQMNGREFSVNGKVYKLQVNRDLY
jgi:uncharacterized repeat protein (TIGR02543 family)